MDLPLGITGSTGAVVLLAAAALAGGQGAQSRPARAELRWADEETGRTLFALEDIVRFDWERQLFELRRRRAMDLLGHACGQLSRPFTVRDGRGVVYRGTFMSPGSSMSFDGPTITIFPQAGGPAPPLFAIDGGYPAENPSSGKGKVRFSPRVKAALAAAGVLARIDPARPPEPIRRTSSAWVGRKGRLRIRADAFDETFRIGSPARLHVYFAAGREFTTDADLVEIHTTLTANDRRFFCTTDHGRTALKEALGRRVRGIEYRPWGPVYGAKDATAGPGPAELTVRVLLRKRLGANTYSAAVETWTVGPIKLTILAAPAGRAASQPATRGFLRADVWASGGHLWTGGAAVAANWSIRVVTTEKFDSKWHVRRPGATKDDLIGTNITSMGEVYELKPSPNGRYLAVLSVGEGHPELEVVDLPLLVRRGQFKVLRGIDPYPGGVGIDRWDGARLIVGCDMLLTRRGKDGRVPYALQMEGAEQYALDIPSGAAEPLTAGAKDPLGYFIKQLSSKDAGLREAAVLALRALKDVRAIGALTEALKAEAEADIRAEIQKTVKELSARARSQPAARAAVGRPTGPLSCCGGPREPVRSDSPADGSGAIRRNRGA